MTMYEGMVGMHLAWMLVMAVIIVIPFWRICSKAGYPGGLSLLILIPLVNLVFLYFLAFSRWPAHRTFR